LLDTPMVVTVKVPMLDPAGTVRPMGTNAAVPVVQSSTAMPPAGAAVFRVTIPRTEVPPLILVGVTDTLETDTVVNGLTVRDAVLLTPL
jgi:hypothetical protein